MPGSGNEQTDPANVEGKGRCGYWTRSIPIPRVCFIIMMLCVVIWSLSTLLKDVPLRDRDRVSSVIQRTPEQAAADRDSPDTQLVGYCTRKRTFSVWGRGSVDVAVEHVTVIYEGREYRAVHSAPDNFLRSLLDSEHYPKLAAKPRKRIPLRATTDSGAINAAMKLLKGPD